MFPSEYVFSDMIGVVGRMSEAFCHRVLGDFITLCQKKHMNPVLCCMDPARIAMWKKLLYSMDISDDVLEDMTDEDGLRLIQLGIHAPSEDMLLVGSMTIINKRHSLWLRTIWKNRGLGSPMILVGDLPNVDLQSPYLPQFCEQRWNMIWRFVDSVILLSDIESSADNYSKLKCRMNALEETSSYRKIPKDIGVLVNEKYIAGYGRDMELLSSSFESKFDGLKVIRDGIVFPQKWFDANGNSERALIIVDQFSETDICSDDCVDIELLNRALERIYEVNNTNLANRVCLRTSTASSFLKKRRQMYLRNAIIAVKKQPPGTARFTLSRAIEIRMLIEQTRLIQPEFIVCCTRDNGVICALRDNHISAISIYE